MKDESMKNIDKECWVRNTTYKLFGKTVWETTEICDGSRFQKDINSAFYTVPKIFNKGEK